MSLVDFWFAYMLIVIVSFTTFFFLVLFELSEALFLFTSFEDIGCLFLV